MDLNKLKAFMCVVRWGSFTKAAAELFISQPALSKKISDFEKEIGTPLLIRDNRTIKLTAAGKLLHTEAPMLLRIDAALENKVREAGRRPDSQLAIGCSGIEYGRLPKLMEGFRKAYPEINIVMHRYTAADNRQMLLTNMIDIAFLMHFEIETAQEFASIPFCRDELAVVMSKNHPLASQEEVQIGQLRDEVYFGIQPQQDHVPFTYMINRLCEGGYEPREIRAVNSVEDLLLSVSCGLGIAHLSMQTKNANSGLVHYARCKDFAMEHQVDAVWNRSNSNPAIVTFTEYLRELNLTEAV